MSNSDRPSECNLMLSLKKYHYFVCKIMVVLLVMFCDNKLIGHVIGCIYN